MHVFWVKQEYNVVASKQILSYSTAVADPVGSVSRDERKKLQLERFMEPD